ncbi:MAG: hypothetical protein ACI9EF_002178 [Pseudohongiellaceae bacterium]|jgi:hypothetical protein
MKNMLLGFLLLASSAISACSSPEIGSHQPRLAVDEALNETPHGERTSNASAVMLAFGYEPVQFEAGLGMATIDDFSAPRSSGGPAGYSIESVDGQPAKRAGADVAVTYVPYVWLSAGCHELVLTLRPEVSRELGLPETVILEAVVDEGINYRPYWNGSALKLVQW